MLRALAAGVLVSISCSIVGTFVVLRGLAFIGDALAHGVLPGVAVALILGIPGMVGAAVGALVMIAGVSVVTARSRLSSDSAIGLLFVGMLALGVVIVSRSTTFSGDLIRILFGEILGIGPRDLLIQAIAALLVAVAAFVFARPFLLLCFDRDQAQVAGFSARLLPQPDAPPGRRHGDRRRSRRSAPSSSSGCSSPRPAPAPSWLTGSGP